MGLAGEGRSSKAGDGPGATRGGGRATSRFATTVRVHDCCTKGSIFRNKASIARTEVSEEEELEFFADVNLSWEDHSPDQAQYDGNIKYEIIKASFVFLKHWQGCGNGECQQLQLIHLSLELG